MLKKLFICVVLIISLIGVAYFLSIKRGFSQFSFSDHCAFCNPAILTNQKFYEDDLILALYTHKPILPGHCLIVSKRHVERFEKLTDEEISQIGKVIKKVNRAVTKTFGTSSYLLLQKNGLEVGQSVPHVHFHYVPRKAHDNSTIQFIVKMYIANVKHPISQEEMAKTIKKLKEEIKQL